MLQQLRITAVASLVLVLTLVGCGSSGDNQSPEAAWADGLCGALTDWKASLNSAASTLKSGDATTSSKLDEAATAVSDANAQLSHELKSLGSPPSSGGAEAKAVLQDLSNQLAQSADQIRGAAKNVSTASEVVAAVNVASGAVLTMSTQISGAVDTLQANAGSGWKDAFADSQACQSLKKS
jgi:hypothetical protein